MSTQTASASAGPSGSTLRLMDHWIAKVEFSTLIDELRAAGVPENGGGSATVEKFILHANVAAVSQEQFDDDAWQLKMLAIADRQEGRNGNDSRRPTAHGQNRRWSCGQRTEEGPGGGRTIHFARELYGRPAIRKKAKGGGGPRRGGGAAPGGVVGDGARGIP